MTTYNFTVSGMHCASCGMLIDETLEELTGVRISQTSLRAGRTTVKADTALDTDAVISAITQLGYKATLEKTS